MFFFVHLAQGIIRQFEVMLECPVTALSALAVELCTLLELLADCRLRSCRKLVENLVRLEGATPTQAPCHVSRTLKNQCPKIFTIVI